MYVAKRDGKTESVKFDKITARIIKMCYGLDPLVSPEAVAMKVIEGLFDGVSTTELDNLAAEVAAAKTIDHPDYALLASRIAVSNLHKETKKTFSEVMHDLYHYVDNKTKQTNLLRSLQKTFIKSSWITKKCSTLVSSTTATSVMTTLASKH